MVSNQNMEDKKTRRGWKKSNVQNIVNRFEERQEALEGDVIDPEAIETEDAPNAKDKWVEEDADLEKYLTMKQKLFCQYYASHEELLWNGVRSYAKAYGIDEQLLQRKYKIVQTQSSRLLSNVIICRYISSLLDLKYSDEFLDNQLWLLALQNEDRKVKIEAIKELNKLKQRIVDKTETLLKTEWPLVQIIRSEPEKKKVENEVESEEENDIE